ncbi:MAG TPA: alanine--tRNA ligase [Acidimicrobiia bacterium]|nr:alanine--tRNA ligase [Acidimicrobiia bacterium]
MTSSQELTPLDKLRESFLSYFESKGHKRLPSSNIIPHDPTVLFTMAGMLQFKPYFVGLETPPVKRATTSQKCVRAGGKHNDLDDIGRTNRHFTFFEMLGNFSFGDYFKQDAIEFAWEYSTQVLGFEEDRLWVTIHETDDDSEKIWQEVSGLPVERIQRLDKDNFWQMGDVGPCGPCTELFYDLGEELGEDGGPKFGGENRFVEFWNLVFMQYEDQADGTRVDLPAPCVDTGAGLERILFLQEGKKTIWETSLFMPLIHTAEKLTSATYGKDETSDISLRIMAEHARSMAFLVSDGCVPSNEDRGYVLRRIMRRAVRHAYMLGAHDVVMPKLVEHVISVMERAYPELRENASRILTVVQNEEERFRETLVRGLNRLDGVLEKGDVSGEEAFFLHDTLGFPFDLTREIAGDAGREIDAEGFQKALKEQSKRSKDARKDMTVATTDASDFYKAILDSHGPTQFVGRETFSIDDAHVVGIVNHQGESVESASAGKSVSLLLNKTPFYAESGGQVGDTGTISADALEITVTDTQYGIAGSLFVHHAAIEKGEVSIGDVVTAEIDGVRRNRIRRNHTGTHVLHWALRKVLGEHVAQAGSHVDDHRLRFDFQHFEQVTQDQLNEIERLTNEEIIKDPEVTHEEMNIEDAKKLGAIAFFGDKYGDRVRVLVAGPSIEFCGGTHVDRLGFIGPVRITSESSIGSNIRRIEAITGDIALESFAHDRAILRELSADLKTAPDEISDKISHMRSQAKELTKTMKAMKSDQLKVQAAQYAQQAVGGVVVVRHDGASPDDLRTLCLSVRDILGTALVGAVGLNEDKSKAGVCVAISKDLVAKGADASQAVKDAVALLGGGTAKNPELVVGGGPNIAAIDEAKDALLSSLATMTQS